MTEILQRGIANYWILEYKRLKENYKCIELLLNEYRKDHEKLMQLKEENENLKKILLSSGQPKTQKAESS